MDRKRMGETLVGEILAAAGAPVEGDGLSISEMQAAVREGRALAIYYWSHFGDGEASFGFAEDFGLDYDGRVAPGYLVFPRPIPLHLRKNSGSDWEKAADVVAAFRAASRPDAAKTEHDRARYQRCSICSQLSDQERGFQKVTREEEDVFLPAASERLEVVIDLKPSAIRLPLARTDGETPQFLEIPS